jgi:putative heme-binding domain-containing protein
MSDPAAAVELALPHLGHPDRFIRAAARVALEHQPIELWQDRALSTGDALGRITAAVAVARQADPDAQPAVFAALDGIDTGALDDSGRLDFARACELAIVRLGAPPAEVQARIAEKLAPFFPSGTFDLDRELSCLLVAVRAPGIVPRLVALLAQPTASAAATNLAANEDDLRRVLERNAQYGAAVRSALEKRADLIQVHYAYALRTVKEPGLWSAADRKTYLDWFVRAREWEGGNSFRKFLAAIESESLDSLSDNDKLALEATGVRQPYVTPPLPKPQGPGRTWTVDGVMEAAQAGLGPGTRDFESGQRTYAAARCVVCHRFGGDGGATGPDLTQAAGRFQVKDLVEAIVEPSRVVSDQYKAMVVHTADGRVVTGRIVSETPERFRIVTDPEDSTKSVEIERSNVEAMTPSAASLMPAGLLDQLNESETLDLVAYVLSRGDKRDPRFAKPRKKP